MAEQKLPDAIQRQLDQAAEIEKAMAQQAAPSDTQGEPSQPVNTETPPPEPEPEPATLEPVDNEPTEPEPAPAPAPVAEETWEQKFKTLEGKYANEVPALAARYREEQEKRQQTEERLKKLEEKISTPPEPPRQALITKEDEDAFGKDLVDFTARAVQEGMHSPLSVLTKKIQDLENAMANLQHLPKQFNSMQDHVEQTEDSMFWAEVAKQVPDWREIDEDPRWATFLNSAPEFSSMTYRDLATDAISKRNVAAIVKLAGKWKEVEGITQAEQAAAKNQKKLESQITPSKGSKQTPPPAEPEIWTMQRYHDAFDIRKTQGMKATEVQALQLAADTALAEGRVQ